MRAKLILNAVPQSKVRLVYERFSVTRVATTFVFVALAHCIVQISLQAIAYSANTEAGHTVSRVLRDSDIPPVFATVDDGALKICDKPTNASTCRTIASVAVPVDINQTELRFSFNGVVPFRRDVNVSELSVQCIQALNWPNMILNDSRREDICFLVFQVWLLGISIVAILNESIPHLMAALVTHGLSSIWSAFQVSRCQSYAELYKTLVVRQACDGTNVLSGFWAKRMNLFVPILALNAVAFLVTSIVSYSLFRVYIHQTFKRVGYSDRMNTLYSYILSFSVALQLSAFIVICAAALWLDALFTGPLADSASDKTLFRVVFINICIWTLPWIFIGWTSFRRENRLLSSIFFATGLVMLAAWISVFPTKTFKRRFSGFPFFATMVAASFVVLAVTLLLGIICRLNFGKGLPQYLKSQDLIDESIFVPVTLSKKRSYSFRSLILPERLEDGAHDTLSRAGKLDEEIEVVHNDSPPAYSVENPVGNAQHSDLPSDQKLPLRDVASIRPAGGKADWLTVPDAIHRAEPSVYAHDSSSPQDVAELPVSSQASANSSLLGRWNVFRGGFDSRSLSRTSASNDQGESTGSLSDSESPYASSTLPHFRRDRTISISQSLSSPSARSYVSQPPPAVRLGLPPSPNYLRKSNG